MQQKKVFFLCAVFSTIEVAEWMQYCLFHNEKIFARKKQHTCFTLLTCGKNRYTHLFMEIFMSDTEIKEQQPAPDFTLPAVGSDDVVKDGQVDLQSLRGRTIVLYFYPKDNTPGCTKEACSFRDANHEMQKRGIVVLGVSTDD